MAALATCRSLLSCGAGSSDALSDCKLSEVAFRLLLQTPQGHPALCSFMPHLDCTRNPLASVMLQAEHVIATACKHTVQVPCMQC